MLKRRQATTSTSVLAMEEPTNNTSDASKLSNRKLGSIQDIPELTRLLKCPTVSDEHRVEATRGFRRILSVERDPPVDEVLKAGVLQDLVHNLLARPADDKLIFESAWALTNIASTTRTYVVVDAGAVPPLIQLLKHTNADVREQASWCLGNIAGDNKDYRDLLLQQGIVEPL